MSSQRARVVIVEGRLSTAEAVAAQLDDRGYDARAFDNGNAALEALYDPLIDTLVLDLRTTDVSGWEVLDTARARRSDVPIIVVIASGAIDAAVESIRRGAYHYIVRPFKPEELALLIDRARADRAARRETAALRKTVGEQFSRDGLVARSVAMQRVIALVDRVAPTDIPVLVRGETGTGKGVLARAIHGESRRAGRPFVVVNCAAVPGSLLESELFGHVKGAFPGATTDHAGLFIQADGGTMLLDEIGEMSPALQAKLLRVLETSTVRPVGASRERRIDVRVIAATHRNLGHRVIDGSFREDLLYRLNGVTVELPRLHQRRADIPLLVGKFVLEARERYPEARATRFSRDALRRVMEYSWPGNVRELHHFVERSVLLAPGPQVTEMQAAELSTERFQDGDVITLHDMQRRYARWAFAQLGSHKTRTAEALDIDTKTLNRLLASKRDS